MKHDAQYTIEPTATCSDGQLVALFPAGEHEWAPGDHEDPFRIVQDKELSDEQIAGLHAGDLRFDKLGRVITRRAQKED